MHISTAFFRRTLKIHVRYGTTIILNRQWCSSFNEGKIEIPKRIPRGPTDILRALESTITRDPTAPHYKYHDDPFLIPMSNMGKRTFAMAQEAGRKAAQWVKNEHPELFSHREADPMISSFLPKMVYNDKSEVTEEDLKNAIANIQISDSMLVYKLLKDKGHVISEQTLQDFLELICFYNENDSLSDDIIEERWFRQISNVKDRQRKTWKDGGLAEDIFKDQENHTANIYATMIQGMCKYFQVDRAYQLYQDTQKKGLVMPVEVYNSLIRVANVVKEGYDLRWAYILELLNDMNRAGIKPNLATMNSVLYSNSTMGKSNIPKENVLKILSEFKQLGIEPSLGTWYYVLITFCKERGPVSMILHDIMNEVENKSHNIRDHADTNFFVTAMDVSANHLNDLEMGIRVNRLLNVGNNYNLIGDSFRESIYYRHYFNVHIKNSPLEDFMENVYNILVPNIYVPEPSVMLEILRQVDLNAAIEFVPKLWSDMIIFEHTKRENLLELILNIMGNNKPTKDSPLHERFAYIAQDINERIENQHELRTNKLSLTGDQLGTIMMLQLRANNFTKACKIMEKLADDDNRVVGVPKWEDLSLFIDHCIENKSPGRAIACIQYCSDSGFPNINTLAEKLLDKLTLDETHLSRLTRIVGEITPISKSPSG